MDTILQINLSILFMGIIVMSFFITCTKNRNIQKSLIVGMLVSALWFFIKKIMPYLY